MSQATARLFETKRTGGFFSKDNLLGRLVCITVFGTLGFSLIRFSLVLAFVVLALGVVAISSNGLQGGYIYQIVTDPIRSILLRLRDNLVFSRPIREKTFKSPFPAIDLSTVQIGNGWLSYFRSGRNDIFVFPIAADLAVSFLDDQERADWDKIYGMLFKKLFALGVRNVRFASVQLPHDMAKYQKELNGVLAVPITAATIDSYSPILVEHFLRTAEAARDQVMLIMVALPRRRAWPRQPSSVLTNTQIRGLPISRIDAAIEDTLTRFGLRVDRARMDPASLVVMTRLLLDPADANMSYLAHQRDEDNKFTTRHCLVRGAWPDEITVDGSSIECDGTSHRIVTVRNLGDSRNLSPGFFDEMWAASSPDCLVSWLIEFRLRNNGPERFWVRQKHVSRAGKNNRRNVVGPEHEMAEAALYEARRRAVLAFGHIQTTPDVYFRLSGQPEEAELAADDLLASLLGCDVTGRLIKGRSRQVAALLASMGLK